MAGVPYLEKGKDMHNGLNVPAHVAIEAVHTAEIQAAEYRTRAVTFAYLVIEIARVELDCGVPTGSAYDAMGDVVSTLITVETRNTAEQGVIDDAAEVRQEFRNSGHFAEGDLLRKDFDLRDEVELTLTVNMTHTYTGDVTITVERAEYDEYLRTRDMDAFLNEYVDDVHEQMMDNSDYECDWHCESIEEN
jgi:hypothetical protein